MSRAEDDEPLMVMVDNRGRVGIGKLVGKHKRFLATVLSNGAIILEPAVVVPVSSVEGGHRG